MGVERQELLDGLGTAISELDEALGLLAEAYELLDVASADRMEEQLFRPLQQASARAKRTATGFAKRSGLGEPAPGRSASAPAAGTPGLIDAAVQAAGRADLALVELQDAPWLVEVGDTKLRSGVADTRQALGGVAAAAREFTRVLGR